MRTRTTRVEILVVIVMFLQGINYLFTLFGNPVRWGVDLGKRVTTLERTVTEKCCADSNFYAANVADHTAMKNDISLIKNAVLSRYTAIR